MVLLQCNAQLQTRLEGLQSQLPAELATLVAAALAPLDDELALDSLPSAPKAVTERTVSHELLVKVAQWARGHEGGERAGKLAAKGRPS